MRSQMTLSDSIQSLKPKAYSTVSVGPRTVVILALVLVGT
jgi:hypothetical protein